MTADCAAGAAGAAGRPWHRSRPLRPGRGPRAWERGWVAVVLVGTLGLGGCAGSPVDLSEEAAARLQEAVWSVTSAAAQGRLDAATTALERVRSELDRAVEADDISVQRYREVDDALRAVEAEVAALRQTAAAPDGAPAPQEQDADAAPAPAPDDAVVAPLPVEPGPAAEPPAAPDADGGEPGGGREARENPGSGNQGNGVGRDGNRGRGQG